MSSGERGSVSIVVVALMAVALVLAMGAADLARVLTGAARAQTAADAAALAAAQELASASGADPAELAAAYADRNGAVLTACSCDAGSTEAVVTVTIAVGELLLGPDDRVVTARARAVVDVPAPPA
jgi:secretion/DNA translocation related TadE-like protein